MSREFWSGTVLTVKGPSRGGFAEQAYASFLCSPSMCKDVLKQGRVLKKAKRTERWQDRFVVLRAAFLTIAHSESTQGSMSKVYQIMRVVDGQQRTDLVIYPSNHDGCENIQLRCSSAAEKQAWKLIMLQGLADYREVLAQASGRMKSVVPELERARHGAVSLYGSSPHRAPMAGNNPAHKMQGKQHANGSMLRQTGSEDDEDVYSPPSPESVDPRTFHSPPSDPLTPDRMPRGWTASQSGSESDLSVHERRQTRGESLSHAAPPWARGGGKTWGEAISAGVEAGRSGRVVGAFWHSSSAGCVASPPGCGHASAVNAVQAFASAFGDVDAVRVLTGDDDERQGGSSSDDGLMAELHKGDESTGSAAQVAEEVLTWLWDQSAANGGGGSASGQHQLTLVLLTNLTNVASLVKRAVRRGVRVVLVSDSEPPPQLACLASAALDDSPGHTRPQPKLQLFHARHVWTHLSHAAGGQASAWTAVAPAAASTDVLEAVGASARSQHGLSGGSHASGAANPRRGRTLPPPHQLDAALLANTQGGLKSHLHTPYTPPISPLSTTPRSLSDSPTLPSALGAADSIKAQPNAGEHVPPAPATVSDAPATVSEGAPIAEMARASQAPPCPSTLNHSSNIAGSGGGQPRVEEFVRAHASTRHAEAAACRDDECMGARSLPSGSSQEVPMARGGARLRSSAAEAARVGVENEHGHAREESGRGLAATSGSTRGELRVLAPTPLTMLLLLANLFVLYLILKNFL